MTQIDLSTYKDLYLKTANEYLDKLINSLDILKVNPADQNAIADAHLSAHSLGSQSSTMGYSSTAELARALEDFFNAIIESNQPMPTEYFPGIEETVKKIMDSIKSIDQASSKLDPTSTSTPPQSTINPHPGTLSILLAEDDKFFQSFYARKLEESGMKVTLAEDGEVAVEKLKTLRPDIILLDLIMPKKNGFEVLQATSKMENLKGVPILVFSTLEQTEDIDKAKQLGATGYVNKTFFDFDNLLSRISELTQNTS